MMKSWKKIDGLKMVIVSQWIFIFILAGVIFITCLGWKEAGKTQRVYQVPNPIAGGMSQKDVPFIGNVYNFAFNIFTAVNTWDTSGHDDYLKNITSFQNYLSAHFREQLINDYRYKDKNGALARVRVMSGITGDGFSVDKVQTIGNGTWVVYLDVHLVESVNGTTIKDVYMQYPLIIQRSDQSILNNPFGMVIAGYYKQPIRLKTIK